MKDLTNFEPRRILVCQLRQIGDVLLSTPSIQLLKDRFPEAEIDFFTEKKCLPVLENNPLVSHVWTVDKKELSNPIKALAYYWKVGRSGYDLIVNFQHLPRCRWVVLFSNAPVRISARPPWHSKFLYTHYTPPVTGYAAQWKANLLTLLGIKWSGQAPKIWLTEAEKSWAAEYVTSEGMDDYQFVTVDPSHRRITRQWPERHFAELIKLLRERYPQLKFLLLYGPGELEVAREVVRLAGDGVVISKNMLTLRQMAAVQARAALHLGNCSAPRHFAVAVDTPSLVVHGATSFAWCFPSDEHVSVTNKLDCYACNQNSCDHRTCLEECFPEDCLDDAMRLLENRWSSVLEKQ